MRLLTKVISSTSLTLPKEPGIQPLSASGGLKLGGKKWLRKPNLRSVSGVNRDAV